MSNQSEVDKLVYMHWINTLANMIYDIRKNWSPNTNLDKAIPYLSKACKLVKEELKIEEKKK